MGGWRKLCNCCCCKHFGAPNMHFHLMYLKHGSIIGLMMTPWVKTCHHF